MTYKRRNPTTIDARTWFYSDEKSLEVVHEVYENGEFKRIARFGIPLSLVNGLLSQSDNPEELRALVKYIPAILEAEFEEMARLEPSSPPRPAAPERSIINSPHPGK